MSTTTDEPEETWEEAWDAEIRRRSEEIRGGKVELVPWEDVKRQARELLAKRRPADQAPRQPLICVDFNARDEEGRVSLTPPCSQADIARLEPPLRPGDLVTLTDGEGLVEAVVTLDGESWMAAADWTTWVDLDGPADDSE